MCNKPYYSELYTDIFENIIINLKIQTISTTINILLILF